MHPRRPESARPPRRRVGWGPAGGLPAKPGHRARWATQDRARGRPRFQIRSPRKRTGSCRLNHGRGRRRRCGQRFALSVPPPHASRAWEYHPPKPTTNPLQRCRPPRSRPPAARRATNPTRSQPPRPAHHVCRPQSSGPRPATFACLAIAGKDTRHHQKAKPTSLAPTWPGRTRRQTLTMRHAACRTVPPRVRRFR